MKKIEDILNDILVSLRKKASSTSYTKMALKEECTKYCFSISKEASQLKTPFKNCEGKIYLFNNRYWEVVNDEELKVFLKEAYEYLTNEIIKSTQYDVIEGMFKQFHYTSLDRKKKPSDTYINFQNGTLNILTDTLEKHNPNHFFRYMLPYDYDIHADCPMFMKYLNRVIPDKGCQDVLAEYIGWLFIPDLKLEKVLFLHGSGCNGKSVFVQIVEALLGKENISHESLSDMCGESGDRSRANLSGKLLNTCSDVAPNAFAGDIFKRIASGEPISTRQLYKDMCTLTSYAKMIFCLNELPKTNDNSGGYYRRFLIVPFTAQIPKKEIDPKLAEKIIDVELPGIMNWVLKGRERVMRNQSFTDSMVCNRALDEYRYGRKKKDKPKFWLPGMDRV